MTQAGNCAGRAVPRSLSRNTDADHGPLQIPHLDSSPAPRWLAGFDVLASMICRLRIARLILRLARPSRAGRSVARPSPSATAAFPLAKAKRRARAAEDGALPQGP